MDVEQAFDKRLEDVEEPGEEIDYWEDDELTPEELTWLFGSTPDDGGGPPAGGGLMAAAAEAGVPDLVTAALAVGGDPALMTDAELLESLAGWHAVAARAAGREMRATEELLRRRKPRVWDRRADRAETEREQLDGVVPGEPGEPGGVESPERVMPAVVASREATAEIAMALTATEYSAQAQAELAADLSRRLPLAFGELDAGRADLTRVRILAEGTQFLVDEDAGKVDALLAARMGEITTGDLKARIRQAVIKIDPGAADRRRKRAERKARFALYGNPDQTATAAVEQMPAHLGAAVKARVNAIARAAKAAGMSDPLPLLEAKLATGLLLDTLPHIPPPAAGGSVAEPSPGGPQDPGPAGDPWDDGWPADWLSQGDPEACSPADTSGEGGEALDEPQPDFGGDAPEDADGQCADLGPDEPGEHLEPSEPGYRGQNDPDPDGTPGNGRSEMAWPLIPVHAGAAAPGCQGLPPWLHPKDPGRIRLTVAWRTLTGIGPEPGDLSWIGPITPAQARELAAVAAADPDCTWRLIVTDDEGHAVAITALRTRRSAGAGPPGLVSEVTITIQQNLAAALGGGQAAGWIAGALDRLNLGEDRANFGKLADLLAKAVTAATFAAAEAAVRTAADAMAGGCAHTMEVPGYRVPDRLRRWLNTRDRTCRNPVCRQPATRCDQDHTVAYDRGGRTCTCDLGAVCRAHHQLKQLPGWQLTQDAQGYFTWRTPAGLTYRKEPHRYLV